MQRAPLELRTVDADGLFATPARQQQPGELPTKPVSPVTRRILGQATARPSLRVGAPPRVPEHRDDLAVLPGAMQVLGQHRDVGIDVTRKRPAAAAGT